MFILIVDDHPLVCSALEVTLKNGLQSCEVLQAHSAAEALEKIRENLDIDLVLLDLKLPDVDGFQGLSQLRQEAPRLPILVLSGLDDARLAELVESYGAFGFLNKKADAEEIVGTVRRVLRGEKAFPAAAASCAHGNIEDADHVARALHRLTPQQRTVLRMLGEGLLNKQIAYELSISESTVKGHVSAILRKFEVPSRMQAVLLAQGGVFDQAPGMGSAAGTRSAPASVER
ncbi:response regulator transcription factor [Chelativorans salis]|uniref:Response regulator transcription factor n=1 Tax=Chelativorans salis TaxID=2978478 RepID=A0ABT2LLP6_9HYPH|nr:response regulator transcription factor [Chelativorans sp. EGI FJ00035]MCT7374298.1 response regulator transcription factor [Chelativorans sp. EGI FJ00035]